MEAIEYRLLLLFYKRGCKSITIKSDDLVHIDCTQSTVNMYQKVTLHFLFIYLFFLIPKLHFMCSRFFVTQIFEPYSIFVEFPEKKTPFFNSPRFLVRQKKKSRDESIFQSQFTK